MIYVKSFVIAVGGAFGAAVLWFIVGFLIPLFLPFAIGRLRNSGGTSAAVIGSDALLIAAAAGFVISFFWALHRLRAAG